jgi:hypothetical protein
MTPSDFGALQESHLQLKAQVTELHGELKENTAATQRVEGQLSEISAGNVELMGWLRAFEGFFRVLDTIGKLAKPLGYIVGLVAACVSAWYAFIHKS